MSAGSEPAYPWGNHGDRLGGLTKRELFAAMAMQGLHSSGNCGASNEGELPVLYAAVAKYAVAQADALIAALEGK